MTSSIVFDYCALIVETLIVISLIVRRMTRGRVNRWALVLISDIILTTIADIAEQLLEESDGHRDRIGSFGRCSQGSA